jgi:hypothetical protein
MTLCTFTANEPDFGAFNETVYSAKVLQINTFLSTGNIFKMHLTAQYETTGNRACDTLYNRYDDAKLAMHIPVYISLYSVNELKIHAICNMILTRKQ